MLFADIRGANQRAVMRGCARITPKYTINITLYDFDGVYATEVIWAPHLPSPAKQKALAQKIDVALAQYFLKVLERSRLLDGGTV